MEKSRMQRSGMVCLLPLILSILFVNILTGCERNDLFEISKSKCSLSSDLAIEYQTYSGGVMVYELVTCSGVSFGDVPIAGSSISFQLVNNTSSALLVQQIFIDQPYANIPYSLQGNTANFTIESGMTSTFSITLQSSLAGGYNAFVYVKYSNTDMTSQREMAFTVEGRVIL